MARIRITKKPPETSGVPAKREPAASHPGYTPDRGPLRGMTERQWFIGLLVASGLLLLLTFRGCILPSGVGPESTTTTQTSPTASPTAAPAPGGEYTVEPGDTLSGIAGKTGTTVEALAEANGIDLDQRVILRVGQKLTVPGQ